MRRLGAGSPGQELTSGPQDCRSCAPAATPASGLAERAARHYARVPTVTLLCIVVHAQTTNRHFAGEVGRSVGAILTTGRARTQPVGAALGCGISAVAAVQIGVFCVCRWPGTCAMVGAVQGRRAGCDGESGQDTTRGPAAAFRGSRLRGARIRSITPRMHGILCHGHCTPGGSARRGRPAWPRTLRPLRCRLCRTGGRWPGCGRCDAADPACQDDRVALVGRDRSWCGTRGAGAGTRRARA